MTHNEKYYVKIGALSEGVIQTDQGYLAEQSTIQKLETMDAFAMLIGEDGNVLWQWNLPEDIKTQYTLQEVAAFSRWYLKDYPVTVVSIIRRGREQYECRLPSRDTQWFYEHELEAVEMDK